MSECTFNLTKKNYKRMFNKISQEAFGFLFQTVDFVSPTLSGKIVYRLSTQVRYFPRPEWEKKLIDEAFDCTTIPWRDGYLAMWSWGSGPIVLLVHGWEGRGTQLGKFIEPLVKAGFRVVTFDGPGHGVSTVTKASMPNQAAAICRVVEHLGCVHSVIGHSMGGTAVAYATSLGLKTRSYAIISAPSGVNEFLDTLKRIFKLRPASIEVILKLIKKEANVDNLSLEDYLKTVQEPALIIHDKHDVQIPVSGGITLAKYWPNSKLSLTEDLGHRRILKDNGVISEVVEFIAQN